MKRRAVARAWGKHREIMANHGKNWENHMKIIGKLKTSWSNWETIGKYSENGDLMRKMMNM